MTQTLTEDYLENLTFTNSELSTLRKLGEYRGKQALYYKQSPETLKHLQKAAVIESTVSSNRLEGITAPPKRIKELILKTIKPENRSEQEIAGYRDALQLLHQSSSEMDLTTNVILQMHSCLYRYHPLEGGKWKTIENQITETLPTGERRVRFRPLSAFETPQAMEELVLSYQQRALILKIEPLILIPAFVLDFLCIHPFSDGNGRTARLTALLLLYHQGFEVGRYISLERIFEESKESYYETLEKSSQKWHEGEHHFKPWLTYFWGVLLRAYQEFEERVGTLHNLVGRKSDFVKTVVEKMIRPFAISEIERACPQVSRDTIRLVLRELRDQKQIVAIGKGRGAKWKNMQ